MPGLSSRWELVAVRRSRGQSSGVSTWLKGRTRLFNPSGSKAACCCQEDLWHLRAWLVRHVSQMTTAVLEKAWGRQAEAPDPCFLLQLPLGSCRLEAPTCRVMCRWLQKTVCKPVGSQSSPKDVPSPTQHVLECSLLTPMEVSIPLGLIVHRPAPCGLVSPHHGSVRTRGGPMPSESEWRGVITGCLCGEKCLVPSPSPGSGLSFGNRSLVLRGFHVRSKV